ncbi:hypothetical protein GOBAR_AA19074 [Gossypium barbadense]|uniref:Phorbol-ester/DAG-type domain-containing protein n=1 Tax=Gossypium barbadense TaxID=3634 RepID=A0A2P5XE64_GOSBA|nr:hypothetical protein GOBAR_AA19074 [Gossypium barbadense]
MEYGCYCCLKDDCNYFVHVNCATENTDLYYIVDSENPDELVEEPIESAITCVIEVNELGDATKIEHVSHEHCLVLGVMTQDDVDKHCDGCSLSILGSFYSCLQCNFFLHKSCADIPMKKHHWFDIHLLNLETDCNFECDICLRQFFCFVYNCDECAISFCLKCAMIPDTFDYLSHEHPLFWDSKYKGKCNACDLWVYGGYRSITQSSTIVIPRKNEEIRINGFIVAPFVILPFIGDVFSGNIHSSRLESRTDFARLFGDRNVDQLNRVRISSTDALLVILPLISNVLYCPMLKSSLNSNITSTFIHCSSLKTIKMNSKNLFAPHDDCNYFVHVNCATENTDLYYIVDSENPDELVEEPIESAITCVIEVNELGDATKIEHVSHEHCLVLGVMTQDDVDKHCDGCSLSILGSFYSCLQCNFFLHKSCADIPMKKHHWFDIHLLNLETDCNFECDICLRQFFCFVYNCDECAISFCLKCAMIPDTFDYLSHEHPLFWDSKYKGKCNACDLWVYGGYRCKSCKYAVHFECITLPNEVRHKCDKHFLKLTYRDESDYPEQHYCDT